MHAKSCFTTYNVLLVPPVSGPSHEAAPGAQRMRPDARPVLSRADARAVYDGFATKGHIGGKDASSGYGGPAVAALLSIAAFTEARTVMDYGCGQGKLAEAVLAAQPQLTWRGVDQSPLMVRRFEERMATFGDRSIVELLASGEPSDATAPPTRVDRFVSTYCLDLLSESDMYAVLDLAQRSLRPDGLLLLAGITWGWRDSPRTAFMTLVWTMLYRVTRKTVGGCRPQHLAPYLRARGWTIIEERRTLPAGFPWMVSEVISARPPPGG